MTGIILFEDVNLFNFEEDNLNVDDVVKWIIIYNSRFAKHFVRHQGMISISTTRFGLIWEQASSCSWHKHCGKEDETTAMKEISRAASLSQLYTSWSPKSSHIMALSVHSNQQSLVSCNKRPSEDQLSDGNSDIISQSHNFSVPSPHFMNTQSQSDSSEFSYQREEDRRVCSTSRYVQ